MPWGTQFIFSLSVSFYILIKGILIVQLLKYTYCFFLINIMAYYTYLVRLLIAEQCVVVCREQ